MRLDFGRRMLAPLVVLAIGLVAAGGGVATGDSQFMAAAAGTFLLASGLSLGIGWGLVGQLRDARRSAQNGERMRVLGQVSGGLAHQLRNAVAGAKLALQLHARSCEGADEESLEVTLRQLGRVEADLARFLDLGRDDVPRRPCHIVELVDEAVSLLRPQCRHADVQVCWEPPAADPLVVGDPGRLEHIVVNLLSNAVEAAGPAGNVELIVGGAEGRSCAIEVWDSGPGPDAAVVGRLFQPFVTGKVDGVGLGLFVARQAAEAHGGRLDWRRVRGRTCFRVELPTGAEVADETPATVP